MKTIATIERLLDQARQRLLKNGSSNEGEAVLRRNGREVYAVHAHIIDTPEQYAMALDLYHYGTRTVRVTYDMIRDDREPELEYVYGESRSDADSVNTFLNALGMNERFGYRPVNGGWYQA